MELINISKYIVQNFQKLIEEVESYRYIWHL